MTKQFLLQLAALALAATPAHTATVSAAAAAPAVDSQDIANINPSTGDDKWWLGSSSAFGNPGKTIGQTFRTGSGALLLKAVTFKVKPATEPSKTFTLRVGTIAGTSFSEIHSESATQEIATDAGDYWTWTFDSPVLLSSDTHYGIDVGLNSSTSGWRTGIPYVHYSADAYPDGSRFRSGSEGDGIGDDTIGSLTGDRIFHLDLERPLGTDFEFVAGNPDSADSLIPPHLEATFSQDFVAGLGNITIRNLTDATDTALPITDPRISIAENLLKIETSTLIDWAKNYAVLIGPGTLETESGTPFPGIADNTTWSFTTATGDPLLTAVSDLKAHIEGTVTLDENTIATHKQTIDNQRNRFRDSATTITAVFDLVTTYDNALGPLWVSTGEFRRDSQPDDLDWTVYHVMQYIVDQVYRPQTIAGYPDLIDGFKFGSSEDFPGPVNPPTDPNNTHTVRINGSFPDTFGRNTQGWTLPARKPTGTYLAPGTIATVTVPPSLVGKGYSIRVGAHSWDLSHRPKVRRLDRSTVLFPVDATTTQIASPLGGGIYIEVPFRSSAGIVDVTVTGAVRSPYFSAKTFHTTTLTEWLETERHHPAPWADFQTDKFMMQVPTNWIYALPDPVTLMADWDAAMDAMNDLMGFPRLRGKETLYPQVDVLFRASVHAPGYPSINVTDNPNRDRGGNHSYHLTRGPRHARDYEFHEQGHAYGFPKFGGETEANVNLHHVAVLNRAFDVDLDLAFAGSRGFDKNPHRTLDNTAVTWMTVFNFSPRNVEMASGEKAYQLKGHAKFVDIARLFGWESLDTYWRSYQQDDANNTHGPSPGSTDNLLLRLCRSTGTDIRPLLHFWGIHPSKPEQLAATIDAENLPPSPQIYNQLRHYQSLIPADNQAFQQFARNWWGKKPSINGYWTEREHARQWDSEELFGEGDQQRPDGEIYTADSAADIHSQVGQLIDTYFPADHTRWSAQWPDSDLTDPGADPDADGIDNTGERIWGLDPTSAHSNSPYTLPLDLTGTLTYTRRAPHLTGLTYTVWTTTDLKTWTRDTTAIQQPSTADANGVESVTVTLSPALTGSPRLWLRLQASD